MGRRAKNELSRLAGAARQQLALAEQLNKSLKKRMETKKAVAEDWIPDEDWRRDFASVTTAIQHAGNSLMRANEGTKKNLNGMSEDELRAKLMVQLVENAAAIPEDMWQQMCAARARKGL